MLPQRPLAYICGSPDFTSAMTAQLIARGVPRFDIFTEAFASPPTVPKTLTPQTVHIAGSDKSFVWAPELGTILDAAEAAGLALPSGCRSASAKVVPCASSAATLRASPPRTAKRINA